MKNQLMFDCETVGIGPGKIILSLAVVRFGLDDIQDLEEMVRQARADHEVIGVENLYFNTPVFENSSMVFMKLPLLDSMRLGFASDEDTLRWWGKQNPGLLELNVALTPIGGVLNFLKLLSDWIEGARKEGKVKCWANSPRFDFTMLEPYYEAVGLEFPISYKEEMDVRSIRNFFDLPYTDAKKVGLSAHNPLHDCLIQARDVQVAASQVSAQRIMAQRISEVRAKHQDAVRETGAGDTSEIAVSGTD